jgi:hypothetical protein
MLSRLLDVHQHTACVSQFENHRMCCVRACVCVLPFAVHRECCRFSCLHCRLCVTFGRRRHVPPAALFRKFLAWWSGDTCFVRKHTFPLRFLSQRRLKTITFSFIDLLQCPPSAVHVRTSSHCSTEFSAGNMVCCTDDQGWISRFAVLPTSVGEH